MSPVTFRRRGWARPIHPERDRRARRAKCLPLPRHGSAARPPCAPGTCNVVVKFLPRTTAGLPSERKPMRWWCSRRRSASRPPRFRQGAVGPPYAQNPDGFDHWHCGARADLDLEPRKRLFAGGADLDASTGVIGGTPLAAASSGFTVKAVNAQNSSGTQALNLITVCPASTSRRTVWPSPPSMRRATIKRSR